MIERRAVVGPSDARESALARAGSRLIAGVDEVGRGALAGPLCVAAAIFDCRRLPAGVDDSKKLNAERREALFPDILAAARAVAIVFVSVDEIDAINIRRATLAGMRRALCALHLAPDHALIDGRDLPEDVPCPAEAIIGGDALCLSIAAASILAKVTRDRLMRSLDPFAPAYGFCKNVGYGTEVHLAALRRFGRTRHHRRSFKFSDGTEEESPC
jgi:ribonuclease HII